MKNTGNVVKSLRSMTPALIIGYLVVVLGGISLLAVLLFTAFNDFSNQRASTQRAQCDAKLKTIALALDAHRQEMSIFPASLQDLRAKHFLHYEADLHCPNDLSEDGSYNDFYVIRASRDVANLPTVVCPFHESSNGQGVQAFKGNYTKQFVTRPAVLEQASGATVERPGQPPVAAVAGTTLHGGDRIRTAASGAAIIRFADNSSSELQGNADVTVLQSFSDATGPLYTLVRQNLGTVVHRVSFGSQFDVATTKATAGTGGGIFRINVNATNSLQVIGGSVSLSTLKTRVVGGAAVTFPF